MRSLGPTSAGTAGKRIARAETGAASQGLLLLLLLLALKANAD